jgi:glycosyltransferase involved in cell wall biosynthesis
MHLWWPLAHAKTIAELRSWMRKIILFISTMADSPFGGCEELWTQTARLLAKQTVPVAASVRGWPLIDRRIRELSRFGVDVRPRPFKHSLMSRARRYASGKTQFVFDIERTFGNALVGLVVISNGATFPPIELVELCIKKNWPFVTIAHQNLPGYWPSDDIAAKLRKALPFARRCFFVCEANRVLAEWKLGCDLDNAEVIRNPVTTIEIKAPIPWPPNALEQELRMACVGNLFPDEKGQDILLEVLANPLWASRNWQLVFYGAGPNRDILERLVERLKLSSKVSFGGYVAVNSIWRENHLLVMPSRREGLPLTIVEAMWCGRPIVATNVGGISEVVKDGITGFLAQSAVTQSFGEALERMWAHRSRLQEMGTLASVTIREMIADDPVDVFANKLKFLASTAFQRPSVSSV